MAAASNVGDGTEVSTPLEETAAVGDKGVEGLREAVSGKREPHENLPPTEQELTSWAMCHTNAGTYGNYVAAVATACDHAGVSSEACRSHAVRKAKAILKKAQAPKAPGLPIEFEQLKAIVQLAMKERDETNALFYVLCYAFLLRPRSECMPIEFVDNSATTVAHTQVQQATAWTGSDVKLVLKRRKCKPNGEIMLRTCWCAADKSTCPVHFTADWRSRNPCTTKPFEHWKPSTEMKVLRQRLAATGSKEPSRQAFKSMRAGHTQDLTKNKGRLGTILAAGGWSSRRFAPYANMSRVEQLAIAEAKEAIVEMDEKGTDVEFSTDCSSDSSS